MSQLFINFETILKSKDFTSEQKESFFWILVKEEPKETAIAIKLLGQHDKEAGQRVAKVFLETYVEVLNNSKTD